MLFHAEEKSDEEENLPSLETLEISRPKVVKSIPNYFGGEDEEDIPDLADIEDTDNVIGTDAVRKFYDLQVYEYMWLESRDVHGVGTGNYPHHQFQFSFLLNSPFIFAGIGFSGGKFSPFFNLFIWKDLFNG